MDSQGPQRIFHYYDPAVGLRAVVVIDTVRFGISAGGVRMAADLTLEEMVRLARAMSYKFAMLDMPCGGAKAGIWLDPSDPRRSRVMHAFLDAIRPLLDSRAYMAGPDMGTSSNDFESVSQSSACAPSLGAQIHEGLPLEDQLTGFGVVVATRTAAERLGWSLREARVAIEGFGKVGTGAVKYFAREGARLVAVSTLRGALLDPNGLDIDRLLALRVSHGDALVEAYDPKCKPIAASALFGVPCDILVPGARPDAIHAGNVGSIQAKLVVPAANMPYAPWTTATLAQHGIVAIPDFVSNAGGVLAGLVEMQGGGVDDAFTTVRERVAYSTGLVLNEAEAAGCTPYEAAVAICQRRLAIAG
ncbi:MAG: Glu/Leu/Phe/Val dehydrogenase [Deltaproteobacteria bacterium]|nr:Glu/Leu/Phe/Val dehydrogenase [Deltaproteobacteria bacterium]